MRTLISYFDSRGKLDQHTKIVHAERRGPRLGTYTENNRITKREGACGIVPRSHRSASKTACIVPILSDDPQPSRTYRSASRVCKNSPLNHVNTIRIMSFLRLNCRALRKRYAERYITVTSPSTSGVLQKKCF